MDRYRKRPRVAEEGGPATSVGQGAASLHVAGSSPQGEAIVQIPPTGSTADAPGKEVTEEQPEVVVLDASPPSTVPEGSLPVRTSTDEPAQTDDAPASDPAGDQGTTTTVVGEDPTPSHLAHSGDPSPSSFSPLLAGSHLLSSGS